MGSLRNYSGPPNHASYFDGVFKQNLPNQINQFYIESPPFCDIVAVKRAILKFQKSYFGPYLSLKVKISQTFSWSCPFNAEEVSSKSGILL
jgi:hypothetical protein